MQAFWKVLSVFCFISLIVAGIVAKRLFGHPELVPAFHIPAAMVLVWVVSINRDKKKELAYQMELAELRQQAAAARKRI